MDITITCQSKEDAAQYVRKLHSNDCKAKLKQYNDCKIGVSIQPGNEMRLINALIFDHIAEREV